MEQTLPLPALAAASDCFIRYSPDHVVVDLTFPLRMLSIAFPGPPVAAQVPAKFFRSGPCARLPADMPIHARAAQAVMEAASVYGVRDRPARSRLGFAQGRPSGERRFFLVGAS